MKVTLIVIFALLTGACVPYPHIRTLIEKQSGTLLKDGIPLAGVKILQSPGFMDKTCAEADTETITDKSGNFEFPARNTFSLVVSMADDYHFSNLCSVQGDTVRWLTMVRNVHEAQVKESKFKCDLTDKKPEKKKEDEEVRGNILDKKAKSVFPCILLNSSGKIAPLP